MKRILMLGAGLVSKPGVSFLLENGFTVTVASRTLSKAQELVKGYTNGIARGLLVENESELEGLIKQHDIIVSLLPWIHHFQVAKLCLKNQKPMATTSYVSADMRKMDADAKSLGLLFLNEIGVDPGIDHMSAMQVIDKIHAEGGKVRHFYSFCGGLPAPEVNDNPFGYKFSWSPRGVVLASRNSAKFLENGSVIEIEGKNLFLNKRLEEIEGLGMFEVYPNRDSLSYKEIYGLKDALTVMRGTYRNLGWCDTLKRMVDLGLVDDTPVVGLKGVSYKKMLADLVGALETDDVQEKAAATLGLKKNAAPMKNLEWLGLFSEEKIPDISNRLDILCNRLENKLKYASGERDMLIMRHRFIVENNDKTEDCITSTLIDYGKPNGDSSMARTVSLPLAIAVKMMAEGTIKLTGVQIPITQAVYGPLLRELEKQEIALVEKRTQQPGPT